MKTPPTIIAASAPLAPAKAAPGTDQLDGTSGTRSGSDHGNRPDRRASANAKKLVQYGLLMALQGVAHLSGSRSLLEVADSQPRVDREIVSQARMILEGHGNHGVRRILAGSVVR